MRVYHPRYFLLLTLAILALCDTISGGGASSSKGGARERSHQSSGLARFKFLSSLKSRPKPSRLDHFTPYIKDEAVHNKIKASWDHAVKQGWINPEDGMPTHIDGLRTTEEHNHVVQLLRDLDPYIVMAGMNLKRAGDSLKKV